MLLPDVFDLLEYLANHPPTHILAAGYMGYKPPISDAHETTEDEWRKFQQIAGPSRPISELPPHIKASLEHMQKVGTA